VGKGWAVTIAEGKPEREWTTGRKAGGRKRKGKDKGSQAAIIVFFERGRGRRPPGRTSAGGQVGGRAETLGGGGGQPDSQQNEEDEKRFCPNGLRRTSIRKGKARGGPADRSASKERGKRPVS